MSSPALEHDRLQQEEWVRLGAALAALARRMPARRLTPGNRKPGRAPEPAGTHRPTTTYSPWSRRSHPLYMF